jgi:hypothetical protein
VIWTGEGGVLSFVHGAGEPRCERCCITEQIEFARKLMDGVPALELRLLELTGAELLSKTKKTCRACAYSYMEPDSDLTCGHPDSGTFGLTLLKEPVHHCPDYIKFKQHPSRNPDGSLKETT